MTLQGGENPIASVSARGGKASLIWKGQQMATRQGLISSVRRHRRLVIGNARG